MSNNFNYCWVFKRGLPERICDEIIQNAKLKSNEQRVAITGDFGQDRDPEKNPLSKKEKKQLNNIRKSNVIWMDDTWIYKEIHPFIANANVAAGWDYETHWSESCQFTKYSKGDFYDWHSDSWRMPYESKGFEKGKIRKLSVTVCLSDPNEFEGGDLQFDYRDQHPKKPKPIHTVNDIKKGSIIVFPSWVWHRVTPVTKGIRNSLVIWTCGWPFK
tara:strand:- start:173 stop:817 length:645 start_codon:yes stop_codon:yes gene_type:complete